MPPDEDNGGGAERWGAYKNLVLAELKRMNTNIETLREGQTSLRQEVAMLKVKSGLWGLAAGALPAAGILAWKFWGG